MTHGLRRLHRPRRQDLGSRMPIAGERSAVPEQEFAAVGDLVPNLGQLAQGRLGVVACPTDMLGEFGAEAVHILDIEQVGAGHGEQHGTSLIDRVMPCGLTGHWAARSTAVGRSPEQPVSLRTAPDPDILPSSREKPGTTSPRSRARPRRPPARTAGRNDRRRLRPPAVSGRAGTVPEHDRPQVVEPHPPGWLTIGLVLAVTYV